MKRSIGIVFILVIFFLSACNGQEPEANATSIPATAVPPTPAPTDEPTAETLEVEAEADMLDLEALTAHPWQWTSFTSPVEQFDVETPEAYLLQFNNDGTVQIVADCNNASGNYTTDGSSLTIEIGPMTLAACPPESRSDQFVALLGSAAISFFEEGNLYIDLRADGGTMVFAPASSEAMTAEGEGDLAGGLAVPGIEMVDECFVELPEGPELVLDCGYVIVPEFYDQPTDRVFKLGFARINARQESDASPLFILGGGPGQNMMEPLQFANFTPEILGNLLDTRDIIVLNQRGVKNTEPYIDCPAFHALSWTALEQGMAFNDLVGETLQNCVNELESQGVNFDAFNSLEIAADVNAARQALGYDRIFYYGASYGAQLGQHIMRDFPEMLEGVVLDGVNSLSRKSWIEDRALNAQFGLDNLIALCAADEVCQENFDIQASVEDAFALFDNGPLIYTATDPDDATLNYDVEITKSDLASYIFGQFGSGITVFAVPYVLNTISADPEIMRQALGDDKFQRALYSRDAIEGSVATLMHYAVACSDDHVASIDDLILDEEVSEFARLYGESIAQEYATACAVLNVQELPDDTDVNVTADIPTLILGGDLDVSTPVFHSQIVADALPNATFVVIQGTTHIQLNGSFASECPAQIMTQFVLDPTATLDTSCADTPPDHDFPLPDGSLSTEDDSGD